MSATYGGATANFVNDGDTATTTNFWAGNVSGDTVTVDFGMAGIDIAAFGLEPGQKIGDDRYVVLFSNPATPNGEVRMTGSGNAASFALDLDRLPASEPAAEAGQETGKTAE